jgi:hypothetical protein
LLQEKIIKFTGMVTGENSNKDIVAGEATA